MGSLNAQNFCKSFNLLEFHAPNLEKITPIKESDKIKFSNQTPPQKPQFSVILNNDHHKYHLLIRRYLPKRCSTIQTPPKSPKRMCKILQHPYKVRYNESCKVHGGDDWWVLMLPETIIILFAIFSITLFSLMAVIGAPKHLPILCLHNPEFILASYNVRLKI